MFPRAARFAATQSTLRWLLLLSFVLIIYGSLYPFNFSPPLGIDWRAFFASPQLRNARPDMLSNIALFVPFGFFATLGGRRYWPRAALFLLLGGVLAIALQLLQTYIPSRTAALSDAVWNFTGLLLGLAGAYFVRERMSIVSGEDTDSGFAWARYGFIALWFSAELVPFVPTLDWQTLKDGLKPLLLWPRPEIAPALMHAAGIAAVAEMIADLAGVARARAFIAVGALLVFLAKIFVISLGVDLSTLIGFVIGVGVWIALSGKSTWDRRIWIFWFVLGAITIATVMGGTADAAASQINWVPFAAMLQGSMLDNVRNLAQSAFLVGALLWLVNTRDSRDWSMAVALAIWLAILEAAEFFIGGHTSDITKPLLALLLVPAVRLTRYEHDTNHGSIPHVHAPARDISPGTRSYKENAVIAIVTILAMAAILKIILGLPQIPYNVRELFLDSGAFPRLVLFSAALLSIGAGGAWIARQMIRSRAPLAIIPLTLLVAAIATFVLLKASVTAESLADIAGSNNLYWFVTNRDVWGSWGRQLFLLLGSAAPVEFFERPVRFTALITPLLLGIGLTGALGTARLPVRKRALLVLSTIPWLWLSKSVVFDWSSTDNLNELIARNGAFGLGGGAYLYLLLLVVCVQVVAIASIIPRIRFAWRAILLLFLGVPVGWWLLNLGLEPHVHKYEYVFSGVQFLLGPDRAHTLTQAELFARWAFVQIGVVCVLSAGYAVMNARFGVRPGLQCNGDTVIQTMSHD